MLTDMSGPFSDGVGAGSVAAARLAAQGHFANALRLCPPQFLPQVAARLALRLALPSSLRYTMRKLAGRPAAAK